MNAVLNVNSYNTINSALILEEYLKFSSVVSNPILEIGHSLSTTLIVPWPGGFGFNGLSWQITEIDYRDFWYIIVIVSNLTNQINIASY